MDRVQYDFYIFKTESDSKRHNIFPEYDFAGYYKDLDRCLLTLPVLCISESCIETKVA